MLDQVAKPQNGLIRGLPVKVMGIDIPRLPGTGNIRKKPLVWNNTGKLAATVFSSVLLKLHLYIYISERSWPGSFGTYNNGFWCNQKTCVGMCWYCGGLGE